MLSSKTLENLHSNERLMESRSKLRDCLEKLRAKKKLG
jgi:hypothetical protein